MSGAKARLDHKQRKTVHTAWEKNTNPSARYAAGGHAASGAKLAMLGRSISRAIYFSLLYQHGDLTAFEIECYIRHVKPMSIRQALLVMSKQGYVEICTTPLETGRGYCNVYLLTPRGRAFVEANLL